LLDFLYARAAGARRRWFEQHPEARRRLRQPVVSVGNVSVGGTGKTPLVAAIAEWLIARGERPAILSRGYKRDDRVDGVVVVSDGVTTCAGIDRAGDEPLMLARRVPQAIVCVADDRHLAGVLAERQLGATVHVLDDGFQHVQLARDLDILVTAPGEISKGRVLPFGRLREAASAAARAHYVVVVGADSDAARTEAWELGISQFSAARRMLGRPHFAEPHPGARGTAGGPGVTGAAGGTGAGGTGASGTGAGGTGAGAAGAASAAAAEISPETRLTAVAGIGAPERFFEMLRDAGFQVAGTMAFRDHHRYTTKDVAAIATSARAAGADTVVTTAKDAVRFEVFDVLPFPLLIVPMTLEVDGWSALTATIEQTLARVLEPV
jgi:tetraacyldisaccharide 4'-kinase